MYIYKDSTDEVLGGAAVLITEERPRWLSRAP